MLESSTNTQVVEYKETKDVALTPVESLLIFLPLLANIDPRKGVEWIDVTISRDEGITRIGYIGRDEVREDIIGTEGGESRYFVDDKGATWSKDGHEDWIKEEPGDEEK